MLQTITLTGLAIEALVLSALAFALRGHGATWGLALMLCLVIALVWRLGACLLSAMVAGALRRLAGRAQPFGNSLKAFLVELRAKFLSFTFLQPFQSLFMGAEPKNVNPSAPPIVLLHGYVSNRGIWWWFRKRLLRAKPDAVIYSLTVEPVFGSIEACAAHFAMQLSAIQSRHNGQPITLIVHSMGGLMARVYLRQCANTAHAHGLGKLICLGTPHAGTQFGRFGVGACAREMRYKSPYLSSLQAFEATQSLSLPISCIYTLNDDLVYPAQSGALDLRGVTPPVENIAVSGVGHVSLLFSDDVVGLVVGRL